MPIRHAITWDGLTAESREKLLLKIGCDRRAIPEIATHTWGELSWFQQIRLVDIDFERVLAGRD